jgi:SMI1 / KNR4 family (SUKH-1)
VTDLAHANVLIHGAVRPPGETINGASTKDLLDLSARLGQGLPEVLASLLRICNGASIGPGGFFGQRPDSHALDMPSVIALFPEWSEMGWLPVGGDGCGNYFVLTTEGSVGFVDTISDPGAIEGEPYSDLFAFVEAVLADDQVMR